MNTTTHKEEQQQQQIESDEIFFGGIEGGATKTNMVIIDSKRNIVAEGEVGSTNPWLVGFDQSAQILLQLIEETKSRVLGQDKVKLRSVGMSLSGAGQEQSKKQLREALEKYNAEDEIFIEEDILAPVFALSRKGGVNMICGTGSNCVIYYPDGSSKKVGGWGHLLGDEGSGYYIAQLAIKSIFDHEDRYHNLNKSVDVEKAKSALLKYMKVNSMEDVLEHFYKNFSKDFIAGFTKELAKLANGHDQFSLNVFHRAGEEIGRHILALQPDIKPEMLNGGDNLSIICTGGVFKSWEYLKPGFESIIIRGRDGKTARGRIARFISKDDYRKFDSPQLNKNIKEISLVKLKIPAAIGAAVWAAAKVNVAIKDVKRSEVSELIDRIVLVQE